MGHIFCKGAIFEGLIFGGAYIRRGLSTEGNLRFEIDWASLTVGSKLTVFALFYFVFQGNFPSTSPRGGLYLEGRFNGGFFALPVWGAYIWRGLCILYILRFSHQILLCEKAFRILLRPIREAKRVSHT